MYDYFDRTEEDLKGVIADKEAYFGKKKAELLRKAGDWEKDSVKEEISKIEGMTWVEDYHKDNLRLNVFEGLYCEFAYEALLYLMNFHQKLLQDKRSLEKLQKKG